MQKTKIEWCTMSWNPVTGCKHGCPYCYAKRITDRFSPDTKSMIAAAQYCGNGNTGTYVLNDRRKFGNNSLAFPFGFEPTLHCYRLDEPYEMKKPQRIFVVSMGDLFGDWVPDDWILQVFEACKKAPWHKYMFLTKNPKRYGQLYDMDLLPELGNFFYGTTATTEEEIANAFYSHDPFAGFHTFLSVEPIMEPLSDTHDILTLCCHHLVIIGAESGNRKGKVVPKLDWLLPFINECHSDGTCVFLKDSLIPVMGEENMIRHLPISLRLEGEKAV